MTPNDIVVIVCDVVNKAALAALGASSLGISLPPVIALALLVVAASSGTVLTHLQPVGSKRANA